MDVRRCPYGPRVPIGIILCLAVHASLACLLVADDLTGAADACAKFVARGFSGAVLLAPDAAAGAPAAVETMEPVDVLAINTDTRRLAEPLARRRVRAAGRFAQHGRPCAIFKKIDSTLRGHIGAELEAALDTFGCTHAIFAPAFPAMGRIVRDGALVVSGPGAQLPRDIPALLGAQGIRRCVAIGTAAGPNAPATIQTTIERALARGGRVFVCDATTHEDLDAIVRAGWRAGGQPLWVGSAGLAESLAAWMAGTHEHAAALPAIAERAERGSGSARRGRVLLFIGSTHPATRAQQARLLLACDVSVIGANVLQGDELRDAIASGRHILVSVDWQDTAPASLRTLGEAVERHQLAGFVMSGGDTAADICVAMGASSVRIGGEVANGVPWGLLMGGLASGLPVVFKAGGFGARDALTTAVDFLERLSERHVRT
jgi:uncharacterized protein YgbK (DUF1537 family)